MTDYIDNQLERQMSKSVKSTDDTSFARRNYGTLVNIADEDEIPILNRRGFSHFDPSLAEKDVVPIDKALNRIKTYRWFFYLGIIPMILSFAFSDLIVDSLNFLELIPMGMECKTTRIDHQGQNIWIPCSKHRICHSNGDSIVIREHGKAIYRKSKNDYYSLQNWVESMDMECKNSFQVGALGSIAFVGMAIGSLIGAPLSTKFGRKFIYIGGLVLTTAPLIVVAFTPHYIPGLIALLIYGIGVFPRMTIGYVYALELTPEAATRTLGMLMFTGECFTIIMSNVYLVAGGRNALFFVYASLAFAALPLVFSVMLPESPKYLHSVKEYDKWKKSLKSLAKLNGQGRVDFSDVHLEQTISTSTESAPNMSSCFGFLDLWSDKLTLKNTIALAYLWGFYTFGHHCLLFMLKYVPGDKYQNGLLIAIAVTVAPLITRVIQNYMSSKNIYFLFSGLWILSSGLYLVAFNKASVGAMVMLIFIAICIDAIGFTNYYVEFEYFNPKIATLAYGICSMTGRTSAIFAPLVVEEMNNTIIIFFLMSLIAILFICFIEKPQEEEIKNYPTDEIEKKIKDVEW